MRFSLFLSIVFLCAPAPLAFAQSFSNRDVAGRMERLERDIMTLQRQVSRGGVSVADEEGAPIDSQDAASVELRLNAMEEELRGLRGKTEENEFQLRKLSENVSKFQQDVEFRLNELANASARPSAEAPLEETPDAPPGKSGTLKVPKGNPPVSEEEKADKAETFENSRDHYNYAFRLLNQTRYEDAARYFTEFTTAYPKDPLIGNAHYWLGETHYIRRDYVKAADSFRAGFEALPNGPKAADNLLKLSMSLSAMKKSKEACVVLDQLLLKFKQTAPTVAKKADAERTRMGCK